MDIPISYHLLFRHNRGKPPARYSPDEEGKQAKYTISNRMTTQKLSNPLKALTHMLSSCDIPCRIQETLNDQKWSQAFQEKIGALNKSRTWDLVLLSNEKKNN